MGCSGQTRSAQPGLRPQRGLVAPSGGARGGGGWGAGSRRSGGRAGGRGTRAEFGVPLSALRPSRLRGATHPTPARAQATGAALGGTSGAGAGGAQGRSAAAIPGSLLPALGHPAAAAPHALLRCEPRRSRGWVAAADRLVPGSVLGPGSTPRTSPTRPPRSAGTARAVADAQNSAKHILFGPRRRGGSGEKVGGGV